ncbi:MAG: KH domain-containing protein [Actinomycetota bacterium]|nr:KH domain-containing protein [Actinomycetota bacterium]
MSEAAALQELLERVVVGIGLEASRVEVLEDAEALTGVVHGEDLGLFIGRHGQTIDAVQHLAQRTVGGGQPTRRIVIDAEGYRARRAVALQGQADDAAAEALRNKRAVALDAMVPSERKLVHEHLRERGDVETWSEGEEPDRHLVIAPLKPS